MRTVLTERDGARVVHVDEKGGYVYFLASPEIHTQQYLYRVSLREGGAPERLTPHDQPGWHDYQFSVSCVWIRAENESAGAGFVINVVKKQVVTCRHLVADRTKVDVIFPWVRDGEVVADRQAYLQNRAELRELGLLVTGKVVETSDESDLALLELESLPAGTHAVALAPTAPAAGDRLRVIGNRLDLDTLWNVTTGPAHVRGRLAEGYFWRGKKLAVNATVVIGQLPTEEGDSGGPVFNDRGEVVGVATALRRQCPLAAVVVAASEIRAFAGLPAPAPPKEAAPSREAKLAETLMRSTVWVRPTATDLHRAGVLLDTHIVLTCGNGLTRGDRLGVAFPVREKNQWVAERTVYKDPVALALRGSWREGVVLAVDRDRELALIKLESTPPNCQAVPLSQRASSPGDRLHVMSHPSGLEFAWVYAAGAVRQHGRIAIAPGDTARKVQTLLCQLPAQAGSPGGPILNDAGELVGVLAARESTQQVGYAVAAREIAAFMEVARDDRPPRTVAGVWARIEAWPECVLAAAAVGLARQGESHRTAGRINEAKRACDQALSLDSHCVPARLCRARMLESVSALAELDHAVESGRFDREVLLLARRPGVAGEGLAQSAGDLEHLVDVNPLDAAARQRLVGVLLELNEDAKALAAVRDTLRADAKRLPDLAPDLLSQADALAKKFPDAPAIPAAWLLQALTAVENAIDEPGLSRRLARTLQEVAATKDDAARLALLRKALHGLTAK